MAAPKYFFVLFFVLLVCSIHLTQGRGGRGGGGRGGGSRGGGSRGSSSSGSRGSSSSSSSSSGSRGSSSSGTNWDRSGSSSSNKPSPPKTVSQPAHPSAPEIPKANPSAPRLPSSPGQSQPSNPHPYNPSAPEFSNVNPSAPRLPSSPGQSQPSNPHPYNPNYGQPANPQTDLGARVNQPGSAPGNLPPYSPRENPPPYAAGNPPPYGSGPPGNPPPYAPPPYGVNPGNIPQGPPYGQPPYGGVNRPNIPQGNPPPYGVNPGNIPQGPQYGQPPYGGVNRPNIPQGNPPPYGVNQGMPGPSNFPYPRQPGMSYPPGGSGWPNYYYPPGGIQGNPSVQQHKKKGLLGGLFSVGKKPKHHGISNPVGSFGASPIGGRGISPLHMMLPLAAAKKPHKPSFFKPRYLLAGYAGYRLGRWDGFDMDGDDYYRRRCSRPRPPIGGNLTCVRTIQKLECTAHCQDGYLFPNNSTQLDIHCWHFGGHWSRSKYLPRCQPYCKPEECQNGGTCTAPGKCVCTSEYRGDHCEHAVLNCDILKFARGSKISWVCSHSRSETSCRVRCRSPLVFETPAAEQYNCHLNGTWTPDHIPKCVEEALSTEATQTTTLLNEASQEG